MSAINFITSLARKILARESKGITKIPTQMAAEAKAGEIAARLQDAGLPLNRADEFIKSEQDLVRILNMIESTPPVMREVPSGIRSTREAKVFDMEGKEIPKGSQIMGGKKVENTTGSLMSVPNKKGLAGMEYETDAAIKTRLEKSNKKGIANIKNKMTEIDEAIDNASPGFAGDRKYDAQLVADDLADRRFGKDFYDLDQKQQMDLYDEALEGLANQKRDIPDPDDFAQGGRAGFKAGLGKRFLELLKPKPKPKFDVERFREGPIDLKFLENIDKKDLAPFIRTRDTMGPGGYGMYDDFADMPAGLKAAELIKTIKTKDGRINYEAAELFLGKRLRGDESADELIQMLNRKEMRADGGRIGLKEGSGMTRRSFLKILGGLAAVPIVGKFFKLAKAGKTVTKVPMIKTGDVPGKPEWFDALVNKVILEGDDVTKRFATQERQVVHIKKIDDETSVMVTQDLNDGSIMVDVDDPIRNVMGEGAGLETDTKVQMMLKKGQADETTKGTPPDEFSFTENDMRNYMDGPDDYTTEFTENTVDKMKDLTSDLGKIKSYATGKGPTMKEIVESKKRKDMVKFAEENPSEYAANRGPEFDPSDYDDFASGGIARMLGE